MDKINSNSVKITNEKINQLIKENENLKSALSDYEELKKYAEDVVEKHNTLVSEYKSKQAEIAEYKENEQFLKNEIKDKDEELERLKDLSGKLDKRCHDFQNNIDKLISRFEEIKEQNAKYETTIASLEKYIEIMDTPQPYVRNARGAGRKKKYKQEHIDFVVGNRSNLVEYEDIVKELQQKYPEIKWSIKEVKYIYNRYK